MDTALLIILLIAVLAAMSVTLVRLWSVASRVASLEQGHQTTSTTLSQTMQGIRGGLDRTREGLVEVQSYARARQDLEQRTTESIRRLELVIAGTYSKGAAGENLLETTFAQLPPK